MTPLPPSLLFGLSQETTDQSNRPLRRDPEGGWREVFYVFRDPLLLYSLSYRTSLSHWWDVTRPRWAALYAEGAPTPRRPATARPAYPSTSMAR